MKKFICKKEIELDSLAKEIIQKSESLENIGAFIVALYGDLGSGKTTFTKHFARNLGVNDDVTSPTFVIQKRFPIQNSKFKNLYHIDVYRLENQEELEKIGWNEISKNPENIILLEWADKVENLIPKSALKMKFIFVDNTTREIQIFD